MGDGSNTGVSPRGHLPIPLLLEVNPAGKILWMSQRARDVLGEPGNISELILMSRTAEWPGGARFRVYSWHFWRVWESRETVVVGVRAPLFPDRFLIEFHRLENRFLLGFFRLIERERWLGDAVRRRRRAIRRRRARV